MALTDPFTEAARALELGDEAAGDPRAVKEAYRRLVIAHPPDRDPEGFRRVRGAYELLGDPAKRTREMLLHPVPAIPRPAVADAGAPPRFEAAVALLRVWVGASDARALLETRPPPDAARAGGDEEPGAAGDG